LGAEEKAKADEVGFLLHRHLHYDRDYFSFNGFFNGPSLKVQFDSVIQTVAGQIVWAKRKVHS
jgi:hypothetical protein